jgi:hypothetical protein
MWIRDELERMVFADLYGQSAAKSRRSTNRATTELRSAAVVAERLGFDEEEALSLGKALAGLNAQTKGRRLGIFKPQEEGAEKARKKERGEEFWIELMGRHIPFKSTEQGIRAVRGAQVIEPEAVRRYLESKFGEHLPAARKAMERLARSYKPKELAERAFDLYERFRPEIPAGVKGWGAEGKLDLGLIEGMGHRERRHQSRK